MATLLYVIFCIDFMVCIVLCCLSRVNSSIGLSVDPVNLAERHSGWAFSGICGGAEEQVED